MVVADGQPRRLERGRLHREPGDRLPLGDRTAQPHRAAELGAPGVGRDHGRTRRHRPTRRRPASHPHGHRAARADRALGCRVRDVGHLGRVAEAQLGGQDQVRDGNYLYGAFGHDFATRDGRRVMIVALTNRQWDALLEVTGLREPMSAIAEAIGVDSTRSPAVRGSRHDRGAVRPWFEGRGLPEIRARSRAPASRGGRTRRSASSYRGPPLLDGQRDVVRAGAPGCRQLPDAGYAAGVLAGGAHAGAAGAAARRAHRAGARRPALPHRSRGSGGSSRVASSAWPTRAEARPAPDAWPSDRVLGAAREADGAEP